MLMNNINGYQNYFYNCMHSLKFYVVVCGVTKLQTQNVEWAMSITLIVWLYNLMKMNSFLCSLILITNIIPRKQVLNYLQFYYILNTVLFHLSPYLRSRNSVFYLFIFFVCLFCSDFFFQITLVNMTCFRNYT